MVFEKCTGKKWFLDQVYPDRHKKYILIAIKSISWSSDKLFPEHHLKRQWWQHWVHVHGWPGAKLCPFLCYSFCVTLVYHPSVIRQHWPLSHTVILLKRQDTVWHTVSCLFNNIQEPLSYVQKPKCHAIQKLKHYPITGLWVTRPERPN